MADSNCVARSIVHGNPESATTRSAASLERKEPNERRSTPTTETNTRCSTPTRDDAAQTRNDESSERCRWPRWPGLAMSWFLRTTWIWEAGRAASWLRDGEPPLLHSAAVCSSPPLGWPPGAARRLASRARRRAYWAHRRLPWNVTEVARPIWRMTISCVRRVHPLLDVQVEPALQLEESDGSTLSRYLRQRAVGLISGRTWRGGSSNASPGSSSRYVSAVPACCQSPFHRITADDEG